MKTLLNSFKDGSTFLLEVPIPKIKSKNILIRSSISLLSSGTERMLIEFGKANIFQKAFQQPEKVKEVLNKLSTDGALATFDSVKNKLEQSINMGYSNVGVVVAVGEGTKGFQVGDRVVSNGSHSEYNLVPYNLCAKIPDNVSDENAVFTVLSAIGLNGIRLAKPLFGETFLVSGLGIIGLLTAQILKAHGCNVLGLDPDENKCKLAQDFGVKTFVLDDKKDPLKWCFSNTSDVGLDGVIITASTKSNKPIELAANASRKKGRIILVGISGLDLNRNQFYKKELTFKVSCSYGPGRYDPNYEDEGIDYPIGYVRWTEQRNFEAVLNAMSKGFIKTNKMITKSYEFNKALDAYNFLEENSQAIGILLKYDSKSDLNDKTIKLNKNKKNKFISLINNKGPKLSFIGCGNYAEKILIPTFFKNKSALITLASNNGTKPCLLGKKYKFAKASTDIDETIKDNESEIIVICTRHESHAELINSALIAGKHVFVEKPLCINTKELKEIKKNYDGSKILMVGFNRRFSPFIKDLKDKLDNIKKPKAFIYTCNSGSIDVNHWTQNKSLGGGRLIGEACHFVDLLRYLVGRRISNISLTEALDNKTCPDIFSLNLKFEDGSIGTIHYFSNGNKAFPKERLEVFADNSIYKLDNFLKCKSWGFPIQNRKSYRQMKGQDECVKQFLSSVKDMKDSPIPIEEIFEVHEKIFSLLNL